MKIKVTRYVIQFDVRYKGWIAFKTVTVQDGAKQKTLERIALTSPKNSPHLAARSLYRILAPLSHLELTPQSE